MTKRLDCDAPDSRWSASSCGLTGIAGEFSDPLDSLIDGLRHIGERFEKAQSFNNAGLVEKYLSGRFSLVLNFETASSHRNGSRNAAAANGQRDTDKAIFIVINRIDPRDTLDVHHGQDHAVFVTDVELIQRPKKTVRSLVRAYVLNEHLAETGKRLLYRSIPAFSFTAASTMRTRLETVCPEGGFEFLPRFAHGECEPGVLPAQQFANNIIQASLKVVDGITDSEHNLDGEFLEGVDREQFTPILKIRLHPDFTEVSFEKFIPVGYRLSDAMIGPFAL